MSLTGIGTVRGWYFANCQLTTDSSVIRSLYLMVYSELGSVFVFNCPSLNGSRSQWSLSGGMQLFGPMNNKKGKSLTSTKVF